MKNPLGAGNENVSPPHGGVNLPARSEAIFGAAVLF
jgi:hypothetical protein